MVQDRMEATVMDWSERSGRFVVRQSVLILLKPEATEKGHRIYFTVTHCVHGWTRNKELRHQPI